MTEPQSCACHEKWTTHSTFSFDPLHNATFSLQVTEPQCAFGIFAPPVLKADLINIARSVSTPGTRSVSTPSPFSGKTAFKNLNFKFQSIVVCVLYCYACLVGVGERQWDPTSHRHCPAAWLTTKQHSEFVFEPYAGQYHSIMVVFNVVSLCLFFDIRSV